MSMHPSNAPDLRVTISPDAQPSPDYLQLWRTLLAPSPAADLPVLAGGLADALHRAEPKLVLPPRPESEASG